MKIIKRKSLDELAKIMPVVSENELRCFVGGNKVVITINRCGYGDNSTFGYFSAAAYDDNGQFITAITGVTLECKSDMLKENEEGSKTAISPGVYEVENGTYKSDSGYYYVTEVDGRSGIFFHTGNTFGNSRGCIMLGNSGSFSNGDYKISNSAKTVESFNDFLSKYGDDGISLNLI